LPVLIVLFILAILFADFFSYSDIEFSTKKGNRKTERIISLSPSITETLFSLNLGDKVVGVTRFCNYPPEAKDVKEVGGYLDINYEGVVALKPDLVILLPEHEKAKAYLTELKIKFLEVDNKTVSDILNSIKIIGDSCCAKSEATKLLTSIEKTILQIKEKTKNLQKPKTLISIGRTLDATTLKDVYIAGLPTYFNELIEIAGGTNAFQNKNVAYPMISAEGLIHLNPQVIIELIPDLNEETLSKEMVLQAWKNIESVEAVKNSRVVILNSDYISIPGPRFIELLKDISKAIHPEIIWD
jgi:iron complex transport system substrate-binding protein